MSITIQSWKRFRHRYFHPPDEEWTAFLSHELVARRAVRLREYLSFCQFCQEAYVRLRHAWSLAQSAASPVPLELLDSIRANLATTLSGPEDATLLTLLRDLGDSLPPAPPRPAHSGDP
jgi:hypothetical protein